MGRGYRIVFVVETKYVYIIIVRITIGRVHQPVWYGNVGRPYPARKYIIYTVGGRALADLATLPETTSNGRTRRTCNTTRTATVRFAYTPNDVICVCVCYYRNHLFRLPIMTVSCCRACIIYSIVASFPRTLRFIYPSVALILHRCFVIYGEREGGEKKNEFEKQSDRVRVVISIVCSVVDDREKSRAAVDVGYRCFINYYYRRDDDPVAAIVPAIHTRAARRRNNRINTSIIEIQMQFSTRDDKNGFVPCLKNSVSARPGGRRAHIFVTC